MPRRVNAPLCHICVLVNIVGVESFEEPSQTLLHNCIIAS